MRYVYVDEPLSKSWRKIVGFRGASAAATPAHSSGRAVNFRGGFIEPAACSADAAPSFSFRALAKITGNPARVAVLH